MEFGLRVIHRRRTPARKSGGEYPDRTFLRSSSAEIVVVEHGEATKKIGEIYVLYVDRELANGKKVDLIEIMDCCSMELCEIGEVVFGLEPNLRWSPQMRRSFSGIIDLAEPNILILERIYISPEYRGIGAGKEAVEIAIETFSKGADFTVIQAMPLQVIGEVPEDDPFRRISKKTGLQKLRSYYEDMGFIRLKRNIYVRIY